MLVLVALVLASADGGMRGVLLVMILVAVALLIAGATIAVRTFYKQRKLQAEGLEMIQLEGQGV